MKATLLNGALPGDDFVDGAGALLQDALQSQGWAVTSWTLRNEKIGYCLGCFECWTTTPGLCRIDDAGRDIARSVIQSDLAIYLTADHLRRVLVGAEEGRGSHHLPDFPLLHADRR